MPIKTFVANAGEDGEFVIRGAAQLSSTKLEDRSESETVTRWTSLSRWASSGLVPGRVEDLEVVEEDVREVRNHVRRTKCNKAPNQCNFEAARMN